MPDSAANWSNFLDHAALSDLGLRRANNQDSFAVVPAGDEQDFRQRGYVFMVADGMGAHAAGELASKLACNGVPHTYHKLLDRAAPDALRQAIIQTNAHIHGRGEANAEFHGMGTTTSVLVMLPQGALLGHIGDSRVYRLRKQTLDQLTFDHSLVWEMKASGQLPPGTSADFVPKNIITRSLGPHAEVKVDLEGPFPLEPGDTFLLCSDGLSGQVRDDQIGAILGELSPQEAVRGLVNLANLNGGPDNITVVVIRVVKALPRAPQDREFRSPSTPRRGWVLHPAILVIVGVALLAAVGLFFADRWLAAGISALVALGTGLIGLVQSLGSASTVETQASTGPFGKGPYTTRQCVPNAELVRELGGLATKLREAATDQHWNIDWSRFSDLYDGATRAETAGQFGAAVRQMTLAISFMMNEIRHQRPKQPPRDSSSVIDVRAGDVRAGDV